MCIAILKPKGVSITKDTLRICNEANPDGMGFAYVDNDRIIIKKFMKFDDFYKEFDKIKDKSTMLIHFRIATHGKVEINNCHPFLLNDRMALIHNGVIQGYGDKETKTDTQDFIDKVIGNISWKMWKNPSYRELVGKAIGYSKLAILDVYGNYYIINEKNGGWDNGIWYSNTSYKPKQLTCYSSWGNANNTKSWDMYGEESYDDWYTRTFGNAEDKKEKKSDNYVYCDDCLDDYNLYRCNKCGKEFSEYYEIDEPICDVCKSTDVEDVGIMYRGEKYYYNNLEKV